MLEVTFCLGSNMGNRMQFLCSATNLISERIGQVTNASKYYESAPWGLNGSLLSHNSTFINKVIIAKTNLGPDAIHQISQTIELELGRKKTFTEKYTDRLIDIDILFIGSSVINSERLIVPHPHIAARRFVLQPLCEIAPDFLHPVFQKTVKQLLAECSDSGSVWCVL
jgi:2-amino-4-hydroxy-6-hydroxymethyldihydropteridine diphosphokinase